MKVKGQVNQHEDDLTFGKQTDHDIGRRHVATELDEDVQQVRKNSDGVGGGQRGEIDPFVAEHGRRSLVGGGKPHHEPEGEDVEAGKPKQDIDQGDHVTRHPSP